MSKQEKEATPGEKLVEQVEKVKFRNISSAAFRELCLRSVFKDDDQMTPWYIDQDEDLI
mgnify:CR=1 FL=1